MILATTRLVERVAWMQQSAEIAYGLTGAGAIR